MLFKVGKISSFACDERKIIVLDKKGKPFFVYPNPAGKVCCFNLPAGFYSTDNNLKPLEKPKKYYLPRLRAPNNPKPLPNKIKVYKGNNPNKCSIVWKGNSVFIYMDKDLCSKPDFMLTYILYHEIGHFFYSGKGKQSEQDCDRFAQHFMLKRGYNPSQVALASKMSLSQLSEHRINLCTNLMKKIKSHE